MFPDSILELITRQLSLQCLIGDPFSLLRREVTLLHRQEVESHMLPYVPLSSISRSFVAKLLQYSVSSIWLNQHANHLQTQALHTFPMQYSTASVLS